MFPHLFCSLSAPPRWHCCCSCRVSGRTCCLNLIGYLIGWGIFRENSINLACGFKQYLSDCFRRLRLKLHMEAIYHKTYQYYCMIKELDFNFNRKLPHTRKFYLNANDPKQKLFLLYPTNWVHSEVYEGHLSGHLRNAREPVNQPYSRYTPLQACYLKELGYTEPRKWTLQIHVHKASQVGYAVVREHN